MPFQRPKNWLSAAVLTAAMTGQGVCEDKFIHQPKRQPTKAMETSSKTGQTQSEVILQPEKDRKGSAPAKVSETSDGTAKPGKLTQPVAAKEVRTANPAAAQPHIDETGLVWTSRSGTSSIGRTYQAKTNLDSPNLSGKQFGVKPNPPMQGPNSPRILPPAAVQLTLTKQQALQANPNDRLADKEHAVRRDATGNRIATASSARIPAQQTAFVQSLPNSTSEFFQDVKRAEQASAPSERELIAAKVSRQIMEGGPRPVARLQNTIDAAPGWKAVHERLQSHMQACHRLLNRRAIYSATQEAEEAVLHLLRVIDQVQNSDASERLYSAAQQALAESQDFERSQFIHDDARLVRLVGSHQTPVLKSFDLTDVSPRVASEHYRQFAQRLLVEAAQQHPWASIVYSTLGRAYQARAVTEELEHYQWKAVTLYEAAVATNPKNSFAANQLGYLLLKLDRPHDARRALTAALQQGVTLDAIKNLVEASKRLNDASTHAWAMQQYATLASQAPNPNTPRPPQVVEVSPDTFRQISPSTIGPSTIGPSTIGPSTSASDASNVARSPEAVVTR